MMQKPSVQLRHVHWLGIIGGIMLVSTQTLTLAQIAGDGTLGTRVNGALAAPCSRVCTIDGGVERGVNLYHSFKEFSIPTGGQAWFNNAPQIQNILTRVTGNAISNINGLLKANGTANLFLLNPNGIVFGPNARLDIGGSFLATTANSFKFPDGSEFSAIKPQAPPLLTVNITPGLQFGPVAASIANRGNLSVGKDLTLAASNLDVQGTLQAGRDLTLKAQDTVTVRDTIATPLFVVAGGTLQIQGDRSVDISILNHPNSGIWSGDNLVLRSGNPVVGDAHFYAGGNFQVEQLNGQVGNLLSPHDPIILTNGDVTLGNYTGASLQILAGGSVTIPGTITINAPGGPFNDGTVVLSNGSSLPVNGTTQPTLDIRAGTTQFFGTPAAGTPTSAAITIGSIVNNGGLVFLTNQFKPNLALAGDISVGSIITADLLASGVDGGAVVLDSRGKITTNAIDTSGGDAQGFNATGAGINSNGGNITLLAQGDIRLPEQSLLSSYGLVAGAITLKSQSAIIQEQGAGSVGIQSATVGVGVGGDISLTAPTISLESAVQPLLFGQGQSGKLILTANSLRLANQAQVVFSNRGARGCG